MQIMCQNCLKPHECARGCKRPSPTPENIYHMSLRNPHGEVAADSLRALSARIQELERERDEAYERGKDEERERCAALAILAVLKWRK